MATASYYRCGQMRWKGILSKRLSRLAETNSFFSLVVGKTSDNHGFRPFCALQVGVHRSWRILVSKRGPLCDWPTLASQLCTMLPCPRHFRFFFWIKSKLHGRIHRAPSQPICRHKSQLPNAKKVSKVLLSSEFFDQLPHRAMRANESRF